jgi:hypothetical protein
MSLLTCSLCIALPYRKLETLELSSGGFSVEWGLNLILLYDKVKILHYGHKTQMVKTSLYSKKEQTLYFYFTNAHTISCSKWCWLFFINFILFIQMALVIYNKYYIIYYKYPTPPGLNNYMCIHEINLTNIVKHMRG